MRINDIESRNSDENHVEGEDTQQEIKALEYVKDEDHAAEGGDGDFKNENKFFITEDEMIRQGGLGAPGPQQNVSMKSKVVVEPV